jgi:hypothetical protein
VQVDKRRLWGLVVSQKCRRDDRWCARLNGVVSVRHSYFGVARWGTAVAVRTIPRPGRALWVLVAIGCFARRKTTRGFAILGILCLIPDLRQVLRLRRAGVRLPSRGWWVSDLVTSDTTPPLAPLALGRSVTGAADDAFAFLVAECATCSHSARRIYEGHGFRPAGRAYRRSDGTHVAVLIRAPRSGR